MTEDRLTVGQHVHVPAHNESVLTGRTTPSFDLGLHLGLNYTESFKLLDLLLSSTFPAPLA